MLQPKLVNLLVFTQILCRLDGNAMQNAPEHALDEIFKSYSTHQRPRPHHPKDEDARNLSASLDHGTHTVFVEVNMFVYSFSTINAVTMDYSIDILLRQRWYDPRLDMSNKYNFSQLTIDKQMDKIWLPDLFFRNAKEGRLHTITTPNKLVWMNSEGVITYSQKLSLRLLCDMELWDFPLDTQYCSVNIGSYGFKKNDLDFRWWNTVGYSKHGEIGNKSDWNTAIRYRANLALNEFDIDSHECTYCSASYTTTGDFACINVKFQLNRKFGFYFIYAYLPALLVVVIAWMSFLIDHEAIPARISLGLLSVLSLMTQSAAVLSQLPRVSYIKAIDVWFFVCLAFVVGALLEFSFVHTKARQEAKQSGKIMETSERCQQETASIFEDTPQSRGPRPSPGVAIKSEHPGLRYRFRNKFGNSNGNSGGATKAKAGLSAKRLDLIFIAIYPLLFAIFNLIYWSVYLGGKRHA